MNWCQDADSEVETFGERAAAQYAKRYAQENKLTVDPDSVVDLNGNDITVTGSGKFFSFDTANDGYDANACHTANIAESQVQKDYTAPNGHRYAAVTDENTTTYHRVDMSATSVSLRTSTGGMYRWSVWECDYVWAQRVSYFGIACRLGGAPGSLNDSGVLYSKLSPGFQNNGTEMTGAIMNNIITTEERDYSNDYCGKTPIFTMWLLLLT